MDDKPKKRIDNMKLNMVATGGYVRETSEWVAEFLHALETEVSWERSDRTEKLATLETMGRLLLMQHLLATGRVIINSRFNELYAAFAGDERSGKYLHASFPFEKFFGPYVDTGTIIGKAAE